MDIKDLKAKFEASTKIRGDFFSYASLRIASLKAQQRHSLAELYEVTEKHLKSFTGSEKLLFEEITPAKLKAFEEWLRLYRSAGTNTVRNYMCNIRAIFNHAIDNGVVPATVFPFRKYIIIQERKKPRALDVQDIKRLLAAQPYLTVAQQRDIDLFMLIFCTGGTNLKDLLFMTPANIYKDRMIYDRFKTGREYSVHLLPDVRKMINKYRGEKYLLRFLEGKHARTDRAGYLYKDILKNVNKNLKAAGKECGIGIQVTTYVARYSFATIAARIGISRDVIAHILGHGLNTMTDLYIDFDQERSDQALEQVVKLII